MESPDLLYGLSAVLLDAQPVQQVSQCQQAIDGERAPAGRHHHERVRCRHIGPPRWKREQLPGLVMQVDPVLAPVLAAGDELEVPAARTGALFLNATTTSQINSPSLHRALPMWRHR